MNIVTQEIIQKIVNIPNDFYRIQTKSEYTLLLDSGYFEAYDLIKEVEIIEVLKKDPSVITGWLQLSADNRSSPQWYFSKGDDGECYVGHWPEGKEFKEINTSDEFVACAAFIKRKIESTRILFTSK